MRVLLLAGSSGISGDMLVGALCDLGVPPSTFEWELGKLGDAAGDFHLHFERGRRGAVEGVKFTVHTGAVHTHDQDEPRDEHGDIHAHDAHGHCDHDHDHDHEHEHEHEHDHEHGHERSFSELRAILEGADLSDFAKTHAVGALTRIANAAATVRGVTPEQIFLNEAGALDTLADLVCVCVGVEALGIERVFVEQLTDGQAVSSTAREILSAADAPPPRQVSDLHELITPTGAALAVQLALATGGNLHQESTAEEFHAEKIGHGLGTHDPTDRVNALRATLAILHEA